MSDGPRTRDSPREIIDLGGNPITLADLAGFEGTEVTVNGYFDSTLGMMCGTLIESSAIKAQPGVDGVAITRAEYRADNREIRVEGSNTRGSGGQFAASVDVFSGGLNTSGTGCAGTRLGSAPVSTVDGSWSFLSAQRHSRTYPGLREVGPRRRRDARCNERLNPFLLLCIRGR